MKKYYSLISIFLLVICLVISAEKKPIIKQINEMPTRIKDYSQSFHSTVELNDDGTFKRTKNLQQGYELFVVKNGNLSNLYISYKNLKKSLSSSKIGFGDVKISRDGRFICVLNLIYAFDFVYDCDMYLYEWNHSDVKMIFTSKSVGGSTVSFSNNSKYIGYGYKGNLAVMNLRTKKIDIIKIPSDIEGNVSSIFWKPDDKQICLIYVTSVDTRIYLVDNIF